MKCLLSISVLQKLMIILFGAGLLLITFYQTLYREHVIKIDIMHRMEKIKKLKDEIVKITKMSANNIHDNVQKRDGIKAPRFNASTSGMASTEIAVDKILSLCVEALEKINEITEETIKNLSPPCRTLVRSPKIVKNKEEKSKDSIIKKPKKKHKPKALCDRKNRKVVGPLFVHKEPVDMEELKRGELAFVNQGGRWAPENCTAAVKTAIVIPFRNRQQHLGILLHQLLPIMRRQQLAFQIFVIDQADQYEFNRGKLMNVGFAEALGTDEFTCFVFHDVDLIPEDDRIDYGCHASPQHLSVAIDKFQYRLPYSRIFGGVEMFRTDHYRSVNGFSNSFWGWGAEDDNLFHRLTTTRLTLWRQSSKIARYTMLKHEDNEAKASSKRFFTLDLSKEYIAGDGLNSLKYKVLERTEFPLYTLVRVDLMKTEDRLFGVLEKFNTTS